MPTKSIALRIDTDLLSYLEARAEKEHRTLSNMIISILFDEKERTDRDVLEYQAASDMRDYCEHWEPTYNPEDGSM